MIAHGVQVPVVDTSSNLFLADTGHSLAARLQLARMYVGELPLVERVSANDDSSDDTSTESDGETPSMNSGARSDRCIVNHQASTAQSNTVIEERPPAIVRRIVPNRYRRGDDKTSLDYQSASSDTIASERIRHGPPSVNTPRVSWDMLRQWRVLLFFGAYLLPRSFEYLRSILQLMLAAFIVLWNRVSSTLIWVGILTLPWFLVFAHGGFGFDVERFAHVTSEHVTSQQSSLNSDTYPPGLSPPTEHDQTAFLYF
jgi:hypothetical protein